MALITFTPSDFWFIPSLVYAGFCFWMFCSCVYREDDAAERLSWAIFFVFVAWLVAPIYFWKRYRLLRAERKTAEDKAAQELKEVLAPYRKS
jgi:hypothetical protein